MVFQRLFNDFPTVFHWRSKDFHRFFSCLSTVFHRLFIDFQKVFHKRFIVFICFHWFSKVFHRLFKSFSLAFHWGERLLLVTTTRCSLKSPAGKIISFLDEKSWRICECPLFPGYPQGLCYSVQIPCIISCVSLFCFLVVFFCANVNPPEGVGAPPIHETPRGCLLKLQTIDIHRSEVAQRPHRSGLVTSAWKCSTEKKPHLCGHLEVTHRTHRLYIVTST